MAEPLKLSPEQAYELVDAFGFHKTAALLRDRKQPDDCRAMEHLRDKCLERAGLPSFADLVTLAYGEASDG